MSAPAHAEELLRRFSFPPIPGSLNALRQEQTQAEPDPARLTAIIAADVALSAEILKAINSPAFGLQRPVASIPNAVMMLGVDSVMTIAFGAALRHAIGDGPKLERFWDSAADTALVCSGLARRLTGLPADLAYSFGLFHDCGIPLLMLHFEDYARTLQQAEREGRSLIEAEQAAFPIDHATLGYHMAQAWRMPELIADGIRLHHRYERLMSEGRDELRSLVSVLKVAEYVSGEFRATAFRGGKRAGEWERVAAAVLAHLGLSQTDLEDLRDEFIGLLGGR